MGWATSGKSGRRGNEPSQVDQSWSPDCCRDAGEEDGEIVRPTLQKDWGFPEGCGEVYPEETDLYSAMPTEEVSSEGG